MARRRRDRYGRYSGKRRSRRGRRRRRKGVGSIITVRRGLGQLDAETLMPPLVGGGTAALTALGVRYFVDPNQGRMQQMLVQWAPVVGMAVGSVASLALYMMGGRRGGEQAASAFISAALVSLFGIGADFVLKRNPGNIVAAVTSGGMAMMPPGNSVGAIVPEYSRGVGAIVMEPVGPSGQRAGTIGQYGETVTLQGINTGAFGTPGFGA